MMSVHAARLPQIALLLLIAAPAVAAPPTEDTRAALRADVTYLAAPAREGRDAGTPGGDEAGRYLAAAFRRAGLRPVGTARWNSAGAPRDGSGYCQPFLFPAVRKVTAAAPLETVTGDGRHKSYTENKDWKADPASASGQVRAVALALVHAATAEPPLLAGLKGKVALITGEPAGGDNAARLRRIMACRDAGAVAVVIPSEMSTVSETADTIGGAGAGLPIVRVRPNIARSWAEAIAAGKTPRLSFAVASSLQQRTAFNVVGVLEGSDPALKREYIVIGAHYDHLGRGGSNSLDSSGQSHIHHGADDNASGTAALLALVRHYAALPPSARPRRSLIFAAFAAEERGLIGSNHYLKRPPVPSSQTVAMLNLDMVGRLRADRLHVHGTGTSPAWSSLLDQSVATGRGKWDLRRDSTREGGTFGGSDHMPFQAARIPVLFFTTGIHEDYHRPSDTADRINYAGLARVTGLVQNVVRRVSDAPERPTFSGPAIAPAPAGAPTRRASLGSIPDYASQEENGVLLSGVRPGSPAEKAGLRAGDVITGMGGQSIRNLSEYAAALAGRAPGDTVEIVVRRGADTLRMQATLAESTRRP